MTLPLVGLRCGAVFRKGEQSWTRGPVSIVADQDDPGIAQVIATLGDDNIVTATDFGHPEGRLYARATEELLGLSDVSDESKRKIMWENALKLYPIQPE